MNIPIPNQIGVIRSVEDLNDLSLEFPLMIKSMVLTGGRGKAGGIKKAENIEEAKRITTEMFNLEIKGYKVETLLLEAAVQISEEFYLGVTTDPESFDVILIVSPSGGIDIEEVAQTKPEAIWKKTLPENPKILPSEIALEASQFLLEKTSSKKNLYELAKIISNAYQCFQEYDAKVCEINPLGITNKGILALDAKFVMDDNAIFRQKALFESLGIISKRHDVSEPTTFETRAYNAGFPYVDLLPTPSNYNKDPSKLYVGLVPGGAGYGIFSIDEVVNVGNRFFESKIVPVNFMDSGGGPSLNAVAEMFEILMDHPIPDLIITSRFGGISSCDIFIRGLIKALKDRHSKGKRILPVWGRMVGTDLPSAAKYLEKTKIETPEPLKGLHITVGNQKIMVDVIKDGINYAMEQRGD